MAYWGNWIPYPLPLDYRWLFLPVLFLLSSFVSLIIALILILIGFTEKTAMITSQVINIIVTLSLSVQCGISLIIWLIEKGEDTMSSIMVKILKLFFLFYVWLPIFTILAIIPLLIIGDFYSSIFSFIWNGKFSYIFITYKYGKVFLVLIPVVAYALEMLPNKTIDNFIRKYGWYIK